MDSNHNFVTLMVVVIILVTVAVEIVSLIGSVVIVVYGRRRSYRR